MNYIVLRYREKKRSLGTIRSTLFSPSPSKVGSKWNLVHIISDMRIYMYIYIYIIYYIGCFKALLTSFQSSFPFGGRNVSCVASACGCHRFFFLHAISTFPQYRLPLRGKSRAVFGIPTLWKLAKGFWISPIMLILYYVYIAIHIMERVLHMRTYTEWSPTGLALRANFERDPINLIDW